MALAACSGDYLVAERCLYCGSEEGRVFVHGHYQCISCGTNVDPCCSGEVEDGIFGSDSELERSGLCQGREDLGS